ncbi:MAG: hypothetical protein ABII22_00965 [Candidatus Micrarchaeota archaeon]
MADIFAVRKVDEKTKEFIYEYAHLHDLNTGEALDEIARLAKEHLKEKDQQKSKKKYKSFFDTYDRIAFRSGEKDLSKNIDKILYGKRD